MDTSPKQSAKLAWTGVVALLACAVMWSLNGPLIKLLTQTGLPGISIACYRSLIGGLIFIPFAIRHRVTYRRAKLRWRIGSVAAFTLMTAAFVIATTRTAAASAIILQYTSPIWVFVLSPLLLRERPARGDTLWMILAMSGVAIMFLGHPTSAVPILIVALASGLGYGLVTVTLRGLHAVHPFAVVPMNFLGSGLLLVPAVALWGTFTLTPRQLLLVVALSVVQMAIPYVIFSWALQRVEAHRASLIVLIEPLLNAILTYLVVGELVPLPTLLGGPIILMSVVGSLLFAWRRKQRLRNLGGITPDVAKPPQSQ